ncbi:nucleosome assembly protein 1;1-like isoform X1 [Musa acuminata AAA Group]|uniref:nucleosome assembly protein 1;1-like isoform X1 n=1 Tax=Musa acuminata AAA Group TaxID=214697 RepID=UPI0031CFD2D3
MNGDKDSNLNLSDLSSALPSASRTALSARDRAGVVEAIKSKVESLAEQHPVMLDSLAPKVRKRVEALRAIQSQYDDLEAKFFVEKAALEAKYQKLYEPLYIKRYEIVNGVVEVEGVTDEALTKDATEEKGVPDFWLTAMRTNEVLAEEIQERDAGALKFLKDIKWCRTDNPKGFKLDFFFDVNPYFKNSVLTKTYQMIDDDDEPVLEKAIGTEIEWYPGKCLTQKVLKKKPRKGSKNTKPITRTENCESFFNFFSPPQFPDDDDDDDEIDEDTAEHLQNQLEQDYDIGTTIRDKIIPHAVSWFTGEAVPEDDYEDMEEDDDDEDGADDEDDEEKGENDADDDEKEGKTRKKIH